MCYGQKWLVDETQLVTPMVIASPLWGGAFLLTSGDGNYSPGAAKKGKPQRKITCPHCGKTGGASRMKYLHFDNCKQYLATQS